MRMNLHFPGGADLPEGSEIGERLGQRLSEAAESLEAWFRELREHEEEALPEGMALSVVCPSPVGPILVDDITFTGLRWIVVTGKSETGLARTMITSAESFQVVFSATPQPDTPTPP